MILFTGTRAISTTFKKYYPCKIVSTRLLDEIELEGLIDSSSTIIHNAAVISTDSLSSYACQIKNVLHNFDKDGINFLGEIDFDIDFDFSNYFNSIYASLDL